MQGFKNKEVESEQALRRFTGPNKLTRYVFYGLIFAFPWEMIDIGLGENLSLTKLLGILFFGVALLQPKLCFRFPPKAFWLILLYLAIYALLAMFEDDLFDRIILMQGISTAQLLVLFWISYNVMQDERVVKGFVLSFIGGCLSFVVVGLLVEGASAAVKMGGNMRVSILGVGPGTVGATLALGLIALLGLAYGRQERDFKMQYLVGVAFLIMATVLISTGSRGSMLSLSIGISFLLLKRGNIQTKVGLGLIVLIGIGTLLFLTLNFHPDTVNRIQNTMEGGDVAGRDEIFIQAAEMVNEKPLTGWGPVRNRYELATRVGYEGADRDPHNLYLKILLEVGILGAIPFFSGIGICWLAAWKARGGLEGSLPLSMLVTILMINMSAPWDKRKIFWIILAYALASARYAYPMKRAKLASYSGSRSGTEFSESSKKSESSIVVDPTN